MKHLTVGNFKSQFSDVIAAVRRGEKVAVQYGKKKEIIGIFGPPEEAEKKPFKRPLGVLSKSGSVNFMPDFKMTEEEFIGL